VRGVAYAPPQPPLSCSCQSFQSGSRHSHPIPVTKTAAAATTASVKRNCSAPASMPSKGLGKSSVTAADLDAALDSLLNSPSPPRKAFSGRNASDGTTAAIKPAARTNDADFYASLAADLSEDEGPPAKGGTRRPHEGAAPVAASHGGGFEDIGAPPALRPRSGRAGKRDTSAIDSPVDPVSSPPSNVEASTARPDRSQSGSAIAIGKNKNTTSRTKKTLDDLFADEEEFDLGFDNARRGFSTRSTGNDSRPGDDLGRGGEDSSSFLASMGLGPPATK